MSSLEDKFQRLPTFAKPEHYKIRLSTDLKDFTAKGHEEITIKFDERAKSVKLHSAVRDLNKIDLKLENGKELMNLKYELDKKWKTLTVNFPSELEPQKAVLTIDFVAEINQSLHGFYRSSYKDKNGETKYIASTQFESDSARLAFPCFDEPVFKATFDIELEVDEKLTALSNTNVVSEQPSSAGKKLVKYATTPVMSAYLVAFIVGEFEFIETKYGDRQIPIRLYTVPGKKEQGQFALDVAKKSMDWYEAWFDFKSPVPKVDLIAIPDFSMGAMENWGLVTFRESRLLVNEHTTAHMKSQTALTTAHELAHFWFGNLTTPVWWSDLWLKEGFASYMEYLFCEAVYPELKTSLDYLSDVMARGFDLDGLKNSHKIEVEINDPAELTSIYDAITYCKSNSLLRMLLNYLTEEVFRAGLRIYVQRHQYNNTVTKDLWAALSEASGQDIGKLMSGWTQQVGYPLISVEEDRLPGGKRRLKLRQTRYLADGSTDNTSLWQVPITLITSSHSDKPFQRFLFSEREKEIVLDGIADGDWVKLNAGTTGFYRVQYSDDMLKHLLGAVHSGKLALPDRYGLASDLFSLVKIGKIPASQFLAFFAALTNENEYLVWQTVVSGIQSLANVLDRHNPSVKASLDKFICAILEPVANRLGWEVAKDEDFHRSQLRGLVLGALSRANHQPTVDKALKLFDEYIGGNNAVIHPELRRMVFGTVGRKRPDGVEQLFKLYEISDSPEVQIAALLAAGQSPNKEAADKFMQNAVHEKKVKSQDFHILFMGFTLSAETQDYIWAWYKKNYPKVLERFGGDPKDGIFHYCLRFSGNGQSSDEFAKEFENFYHNEFNEEVKKSCQVAFNQTLESVRLNAALREHNKSVEEFLSGR